MFSGLDMKRTSRLSRFSTSEKESAPSIGTIKVTRHSVERSTAAPSTVHYEDHSRHLSTHRARSPSITERKRYSYQPGFHSNLSHSHFDLTQKDLYSSSSSLHGSQTNLHQIPRQSNFAKSHPSRASQKVVQITYDSPTYKRPQPPRSLSVDRQIYSSGNTSINLKLSSNVNDYSVTSPQSLSRHYINTKSPATPVKTVHVSQNIHSLLDNYVSAPYRSTDRPSRYDYSKTTYQAPKHDVSYTTNVTSLGLESPLYDKFNPKNFSSFYSEKFVPRSYSLPQLNKQTISFSKPQDTTNHGVDYYKKYLVTPPENNVEDKIKAIKLRARSKPPITTTRPYFGLEEPVHETIKVSRTSNVHSAKPAPISSETFLSLPKTRPQSCNTDYKINYATGDYEPLISRYGNIKPVYTKYDYVPLYKKYGVDKVYDEYEPILSNYQYKTRDFDFEPVYKKYEYFPVPKKQDYKVTKKTYHYEVPQGSYDLEPYIDKYENFVPLHEKYQFDPIHKRFRLEEPPVQHAPKALSLREAHNNELLLEARKTLHRKPKLMSPGFNEDQTGFYFDHKNKPHFSSPLKPKKCVEGDTLRLSCTISSSPDTIISWYHEREPLKKDKRYKISVSFGDCLQLKTMYNIS